MKGCKEHKENQLIDYFLNRLSPEEVETFQFHLFHCESCQKQLRQMRQLAIDVAAGKQKCNKRFVLVWRTVAAGVAVLLLLAGGFYWKKEQPVEKEEFQFEMNEAPIFQSGDSVLTPIDSVQIKRLSEEIKDAE